MRMLSLQFKKLPFTKFPFKKSNHIFIFAISLFLLQLNCTSKVQLHSEEQTTSSADTQKAGTNLPIKLSSDENEIQIYTRNSSNQLNIFGTINSKTCKPSSDTAEIATQSWSIPIDSATGVFIAHLNLPTLSGDKSTLNVSINQKKFKLQTELPNADTSKGIQFICDKWNANPKEKILGIDPDLKENILASLKSFAPDCHFTSSISPRSLTANKGWSCSLPRAQGKSTGRKLAAIQKHMLRKWSRQPYLFTRKLSVTRKLAKILGTNKNKALKLKNFCNLIKNSLQKELPLVFATTRWQAAMCAENTDYDQVLALADFGLKDAAYELKLLNRTVEKTSRLGVLQIKIPKKLAPSRNLWVSLTPTFAHSIVPPSDKKKKKNKRNEIPKLVAAPEIALNNVGCWHPVYSENTSLWRLAHALDLLTKVSQGQCTPAQNEPKNEANPYTSPEKWIAESITGESEFIVTNGNSKILRLPTGIYNYKIHGLPENVAQWEPSPTDAHSQGTLKWTARRPSKVIRTW